MVLLPRVATWPFSVSPRSVPHVSRPFRTIHVARHARLEGASSAFAAVAVASRMSVRRKGALRQSAPTLPKPIKGPARSGVGAPTLVFSQRLHKLARESLVDRLRQTTTSTDDAIIFLAGGEAAIRHETDHEDVFRQESNFHYLFGVREPGYLAVIDVTSGVTTLFVPHLPEEYAVWMGRIKSLDEIREEYGVEHVVYADEMVAWFEQRAPKCIYVVQGRNSDSGREAKPANFNSMRDNFVVDHTVLHGLLQECRVQKNEEEVRLLRLVNRISADAHIELMRQARPGLMEFQLESVFAHSCYYNGGCRLMSYTPIAASGPNAAVLHYGHAGAPNDRRLQEGDLVLCDMGSELYCYASDITNTFPANGVFTGPQRLIFETVAEMQKAVLEAMRPGVQWSDMQELAYRVMCMRLADAGLLRGSLEDLMAANVGAVLMPHGLGHLLGIDTHDVGGYPAGSQRDPRPGFNALRLQRPLSVGMVLTVEPGLYFSDYALEQARKNEVLSPLFNWDLLSEFMGIGGVRLEDNVLVTEDGIDNLTVAPRTVDEVEAVMTGKVADAIALAHWRWEQQQAGTDDEDDI